MSSSLLSPSDASSPLARSLGASGASTPSNQTPSNQQVWLATYGTLRRAWDGPTRLGVSDGLAFEGTCRVRAVLFDLGRFPGAVPVDAPHAPTRADADAPPTVWGDLYRVTDPDVWNVLDRYEGYDATDEAASLFVRRRVDLVEPSGRSAWIYWFAGDPSGRPQVASGDWVAYRERTGGTP